MDAGSFPLPARAQRALRPRELCIDGVCAMYDSEEQHILREIAEAGNPDEVRWIHSCKATFDGTLR